MVQTVAPLIESPAAPLAEAIGEFIKRRRDRLYSLALRVTRSSDDAEDAVQDAALKWAELARGWSNVQDGEALLYRLTVQCALDGLRRRNRINRRETQAAQKGGEMNSLDSGAMLAERRETLSLLRSAVDGLPDDERLPVLLCFNEGLSVVDTAKSLDLPRETVRARLQRALANLRATMREKGFRLSVALILGLLFRDSCQPASAALCERLDSVLPGQPCAQLAPLSAPNPVPHSEFSGLSLGAKAVALSAAALVALGVVLILNHSNSAFNADTTNSSATTQIFTVVPETSAPKTSAAKNTETALAEARATELRPSTPVPPPIENPTPPTQAQAAASPDSLAATIRELESRSADKAAARQHEMETRATGEWRESSAGAQAGAVQRLDVLLNTVKNTPQRRNP